MTRSRGSSSESFVETFREDSQQGKSSNKKQIFLEKDKEVDKVREEMDKKRYKAVRDDPVTMQYSNQPVSHSGYGYKNKQDILSGSKDSFTEDTVQKASYMRRSAKAEEWNMEPQKVRTQSERTSTYGDFGTVNSSYQQKQKESEMMRIDQLERERDEYKRKYESSSDLVQQVLNEGESMKYKLAQKESEITRINNELQKNLSVIDQLQRKQEEKGSEITSLKEKIADNAKLQDEVSSQQKTISELKRDIEELQKEKSILEKSERRLLQSEREIEKSRRTTCKLLKKLQGDLALKDKQIKNLEHEKNILQTTSGNCTPDDRLNVLNEIIRKHCEESAKRSHSLYESHLSSLTSGDSSTSKSKMGVLKGRKDNMPSNSGANISEKMDKLNEVIRNHCEQALQRSDSLYQSQVASLTDISSLKSNIEILKSENDKLKEENSRLKDLTNREHGIHDNSSDYIFETRSQYNSATTRLTSELFPTKHEKELEAELGKLNQQLIDERNSHTEQVGNLELEIKTLQTQLESKDQELKKLNLSPASRFEEFGHPRSYTDWGGSDNDLYTTGYEYMHHSSPYDGQRSVIGSLYGTNGYGASTRYQVDRREMEESLQKKLRELKMELEQATTRNSNLQEQLDISMTTVDSLTMQREEEQEKYSNELKTVEKERDEEREKKETLQKQNDELNHDLTSEKAAKSELEGRLKTANTEIEWLNGENSRLSSELRDAKDDISRINQERCEERESYSRELNALNTQVSRLTSNMSSVEHDICERQRLLNRHVWITRQANDECDSRLRSLYESQLASICDEEEE